MKNVTLALIALFFVSCNSQSEAPAESENMEETAAETTTETDVVDMHTSQNALDWPGVYTDTMPCADCEGILTRIQLTEENTYELKQTYLGKADAPFTTSGTITWDADGRIISLSDNEKIHLFVGENVLFYLDENMERITGDLADFYSLEKEMQ